MSIETAVRSRNFNTHDTCSYVRRVAFIRHGDYDPKDKNGVEGTGLSKIGINEARCLHSKLRDLPEQIKAYSADNLRSLGTVALAMYPDLELSEVKHKAENLLDENKLDAISSLDYLPVTNDVLEKKLTKVYNAGKNLSFLVYESDLYEQELGQSFSTSRHMAAEVARLLLREMRGESDEGILLCGREFFYACFRAEITQEISGAQAMDVFVDWYQEYIELNDSARTKVAYILADTDNNNFMLEDAFGELSFERCHLESLSQRAFLKQVAERAV